MPKKPLFAVTALALALFSSVWTSRAQACKCMLPTPQDARDAASVVFEGRVADVQLAPGEAEGTGTKQVTLKVVRTWKGSSKDETLVVETAESSAACGIDFEKDASYLVYALKNESGKLHAGSCGRTRTMADASEDLAVLGAGVTPVKVEPASEPTKQTEENKNVAPAPKSGGCAGNATSSSSTKSSLMLLPAFGALLLRRRRRD